MPGEVMSTLYNFFSFTYYYALMHPILEHLFHAWRIYWDPMQINSIFHSPGHMWPSFFECLQHKNLWRKKLWINIIPGEVFFLYFLLQDFPPAMLPFWLFLQKVPKIQKSRSYETWAMKILPPLGEKIEPAMPPPPPLPFWPGAPSSSCVWRGERESPWHCNC